MKYFIAIFLPFVSFLIIKKPISAIFALILQITLVGWTIATIWCFFAINDYHTKQLFKKR
jgi:hypothetical protein